MSIKKHDDLQPIKLKPIISYPREAQVSKYYLMSIDVELESPQTPWQYPEEEYAISFILDMHPFFSYEPVGGREPSIILHRFGGTYGPAEYLLTAADTEVPKGTIGITFVNGWGIPITYMELECEVKHEVKLDPSRELKIAPYHHVQGGEGDDGRLHRCGDKRKVVPDVRLQLSIQPGPEGLEKSHGGFPCSLRMSRYRLEARGELAVPHHCALAYLLPVGMLLGLH